jgi:hypothetical protein
MLFFGLTMYDLCLLNIHAPFSDKVIVSLLLLCFQVKFNGTSTTIGVVRRNNLKLRIYQNLKGRKIDKIS